MWNVLLLHLFYTIKIITIDKNNKKKFLSVIYKGFPPKYWCLPLQVPGTSFVHYIMQNIHEVPHFLNSHNV